MHFVLVGKSEHLALHSCKETKKYCKNAESGIYWIGGDSMTTKKQVYCDMHTDEGKTYLGRLNALFSDTFDLDTNVNCKKNFERVYMPMQSYIFPANAYFLYSFIYFA